MIRISPTVFLDENELQYTFIRSPGPGGQNVNKLSTGVQLRFNVVNSPSLPDELRYRFLSQNSSKMTNDGDIIIKATRLRTQEGNKEDALGRLVDLIKLAAIRPKKRRKTKPSKGAVQRRLSKKKIVGERKRIRGRVRDD